MSRAPVHVALLRGVNVGGNNKLPMKDLARLVEEAGTREVRTYIQSGNVLFRAPAARARTLEAELAAAIARRHGLRVPVVIRSAEELAAAVARNPFLPGAPPEELHLVFLAAAPTKAAIAPLEPDRSPPDELRVVGKEVYLRCPNGLARTKLTNAWLDARLRTVSTARNWRTVTKLVELAADADR